MEKYTEDELMAMQEVGLSVYRSLNYHEWRLNALLNDFRHYLNDQLIELKYGKGYKASFLDEVLLQVRNL